MKGCVFLLSQFSLTFVLCLFLSVSAFATWYSTKGDVYNNSNENSNVITNSFEKNLTARDKFSIAAKINVIDINKVNPINAEKEGFLGTKFAEVNLTAKDNTYTTEIGLPKLPVIKRWIEFGGNTNEINIDLGNIDISKFQKFDLAQFADADMVVPVLPSVIKRAGELEKAKFVINKNFYNTSQIYPSENYKIKNIISVRGKKLALIEIYPVKYNPLKKELYINENFKVNFNLKKFKSKLDNSYSFNKLLSKLVFNNNSGINFGNPKDLDSNSNIETASGSFKDTLFVVYGSKFANTSALLDYLKLKRQLGYNVISKNISEIGTTDVKLRAYVKSLYSNATTRPSYMVIIGDVSDVPTYNGSAGGAGSQATDHFYASIDKDDYTTDIGGIDIFVSRLAVANPEELKVVVSKIIKYQKVTMNDLSWIKSSSWVATDDRYEIAEGTHNYVIDNYTSSPSKNYVGNFPETNIKGGDKLYAITHKTETNDLKNMFNQGRSIIDYSGHGGHDFWAGPNFSIEENIIVVKIDLSIDINKKSNEENLNEEIFKEWKKRVQDGYELSKDLMRKNERENKKMKFIFVGYSLGAALGFDLIRSVKNEDRIFDKMILLAPAITLRWYTKLIKAFYIFGEEFNISSRNHPEYRYKDSTTIAEYKALFNILEENENKLSSKSRDINISTLVLMDSQDELISFENTKEFIKKNTLTKWSFQEIKKDATLKKQKIPKHLIVDENAIGVDAWKKLKQQIILFINI
ncbi:MAG: hypothetical protein HQK51_13595 [Oligoflexia bacterium]|nr:hypothetical protein [Oligoflexia bacterium]